MTTLDTDTAIKALLALLGIALGAGGATSFLRRRASSDATELRLDKVDRGRISELEAENKALRAERDDRANRLQQAEMHYQLARSERKLALKRARIAEGRLIASGLMAESEQRILDTEFGGLDQPPKTWSTDP